MEQKFRSHLKKKNLSLVTVTNDKFNLKKMLTKFLDLEVRTFFKVQMYVGLDGCFSGKMYTRLLRPLKKLHVILNYPIICSIVFM